MKTNERASRRHSGGSLSWNALLSAVLIATVVSVCRPFAVEAQLFTKVGSFSAKTTGTPTNRAQSVQTMGFQPKAVIFFWTAQTGPGFVNNVAPGWGFATGAGSEFAVVYAADHNLPPQGNPVRRQSASRSILIMSSSAGGLATSAQLTSMDAPSGPSATDGGFTLNWPSGPSTAWLIHYIALGGPDITNATIGSFTSSGCAAPCSQGVTGVGFQPDFLMFLSGNSNTLDTTLTEAHLSAGFAGLSGGSTLTQGAFAVTSKNTGGANVITSVWQRPGRAILEKGTNLLATEMEASVTSFDADGFTIQHNLTDSNPTAIRYLALQGGQYDVGTFVKPAATGSQAYTGVGFQPHAILFYSDNLVAGGSPGQHARISFSAADTGHPNPLFSPNQEATFFEDHLDDPADNDNTWARQGTSSTKVIFLAQAGDCPPNHPEGANPNQCTGTARLIADADVTSYDADGFTLNWTTVDTINVNNPGNQNGAEIVYLAFGNDETTAVDLTSFRSKAGDGEVLLEWETGTEIDNLGFHLYRATSEEGPYERITSQIIPGLGSSPEGAAYSYRDAGLSNDVTYYYELEDIETSGKTESHGPVSAMPRAGALLPDGSGGPLFEEDPTRITYGDPSANGFRVVSWDERGATLELVTEGFIAEPLDDGTVRLEIPGYDVLEAAGLPSLPVLRPWVDAVAGVGVALRHVEEDSVATFSSLSPSGAESVEAVAARNGTLRLERRGASRARHTPVKGLYPREATRVLNVGYQGEEKKAQLEMTPLRWDGSRGELRLARRLTVSLSFSGRAFSETRLDDRRGRLYQWKESYRRRTGLLARLATTERGLHVVRYDEVFSGRTTYASSALRLSRLGEPVAFHVEPDGGAFGPGSRLYFVSAGPEANPYGREAVYELELDDAGVRMAVVRAGAQGEATPYYWAHSEHESNVYYQAALLQAPDPWLWDVLMSGMSKSYGFTLSALAASPERARLTVWLQGASDFAASPDHHVRVYVNGTLSGEARWDGKNPYELDVELLSGALLEGQNQLTLDNVGDTGAAYSMAFLNRFSVDYPRRQQADEGRLEGGWSVSGTARVSGVGSGARVVDLTDETPKWVMGVAEAGGGTSFRAEAGHRYAVVAPEEVLRPEIRRPQPSRLKSRTNGADYLVVGPAEFLRAAAALVEHRKREGLRVEAVSVEEIFETFGFGETRPEAIRDFVEYAFSYWRAPAVRYVLLLGDGTYDFKNYLGTGVVNRVPPLMVKTSFLRTASDPAFGMVNGSDILPDVAVGRLPAANVDEVHALVEKILAYEEAPTTGGPLVLVTDNPDKAGDFEADTEVISSGVLAGREVVKLYLSQLGTAATRSEILRRFDAGASLVSYVGHGGIQLWANENIFNDADVASLAPQSRMPLLVTMNCLNGYFIFPYFNSLSEELLKAEDKGVIAAFSPSGLSVNGPAQRYQEALLNAVYNHAPERLGDAVLEAQEVYGASGAFPELISIYHLLGDPALRLH